MTINVRTHPSTASHAVAGDATSPAEPMSGVTPVEAETITSNGHVGDKQGSPTTGKPRKNRDSLLSPEQSPIIEIGISEPEDIDDEPVAIIQVDDEDLGDGGGQDCARKILDDFPRFGNVWDCAAVAELIADHVENAESINPDALERLSLWLNDQADRLRACESEWDSLYADNTGLWDGLGKIFLKLMTRKFPFGPGFTQSTVRDHMLRLFDGYVRTSPRLMQLDAKLLEGIPEDTTTKPKPHLLSRLPLKILSWLYQHPNEVPLWRLLQHTYKVDVEDLRLRLVHTFLSPSSAGMDSLSHLIHLSLQRIQTCGNLPGAVQLSLSMVVGMGDLLVNHMPHLRQQTNRTPSPWSTYSHDSLAIFRKVNEELQRFTARATTQTLDLMKDYITTAAGIIANAAKLNEELAKALFLEFDKEDASCDDPANIPDIVSGIWKIRLLKHYISKGRMGLRVAGIDLMSTDLVNTYNRYTNHESGNGVMHQVMQYLATFLLREKLLDYIIGVNSHPQIISRSNNIIGFLIVTHRFTSTEMDAIWQTISTSQDPHVAITTLQLLTNLVRTLEVPVRVLLHLCIKLRQVPCDHLGVDYLNLLNELLFSLRKNYAAWLQDPSRMNPFTLCIEMIRGSSSTRTRHNSAAAVFAQASEQLSHLAQAKGVDASVRRAVYEECVNHIRDKTGDSLPDIHAIHMMTLKADCNDIRILIEDLDLVRLLIDELCTHVQSLEKHNGTSSGQDAFLLDLQTRLDLLVFLLGRSPQSVPVELFDPLLDHLVGVSAVNNSVRDLAWRRLAEFVRLQNSAGDALSRYLVDRISRLNSLFFTPGLCEFLLRALQNIYDERRTSPSADTEKLELPGADILWHVLLTAPENTIEDEATSLLTTLYVDTAVTKCKSRASLDATHTALIERCMQQLISTHAGIAIANDNPAEAEHNISVQPTHSEYEAVVRFTRTMLFMQAFLTRLKSNPMFASSPSDPTLPSGNSLRGDPLTIQYQLYSSGEPDIRDRTVVGDLETRDELRQRLQRLSGFSEFSIIWGGQRQDLHERPTQTLRDWGVGNKGLLIVRRTSETSLTQQRRHRESFFRAGVSAAETQILRNFETLYGFLDSGDRLSDLTYQFLRTFPPNEALCQLVASPNSSPADLFPRGKMFKVMYSVWCIQGQLEMYSRTGNVTRDFVVHVLDLLEAALTDESLLILSPEARYAMHAANMIVECLLKIVKEYLDLDKASTPFSFNTALIERLMCLLQINLHSPVAIREACQCYETIIEVSMCDQSLWNALTSRTGLTDLHYRLLLTDGRDVLMAAVARTVVASCTKTPAQSRLQESEIATFWCGLLSPILPRTTERSKYSIHLFECFSHTLWVANKTTPNEIELRSYLTTWTGVLKKYVHEESVGRNEVDSVIIGFAKLLRICVQLLKSLKKPLNAETLMSDIFEKFLFPPFSQADPTAENIGQNLCPVLDDQTRRELYGLVLTLCENLESCRKLVLLMAHLPSDENELHLSFYDRSRAIRSSSGYVGMRNLGNTCYMNSLLTQFFMNTNFRRFLVGAHVTEGGNSQKLLSETQKMFAFMQNSYSKAADAANLADSVKTFENQPINVTVQMDVEEFFNLLFDQWERQLLSDEEKQLFRSFYGGEIINQVKSRECEHVSQRIENFFTIQCEVKGKPSLLDSLKAYVEGEVMEGDNKYKCEACGNRFVEAAKRTCLKKVPDNLIFHLKRFDFNVETLQRFKINDYFDFPSQIDIRPYTLEHLENPEEDTSEDMFDLVGILVHKGFAEHGHYFSYIKEQAGDSSRWIKYDDTEVTEFDPADIADSCFGGWADSKNPQIPQHQGSLLKGHNAYMLFYQRRTTTARVQETGNSLGEDISLKVTIPATLESEISQFNERLLRDNCLFRESHIEFVQTLLRHKRTLERGICSADHQAEREAISMTLGHCKHLASAPKDLPYVEDLMASLVQFVRGCAVCHKKALEWFAAYPNGLRDLLLRAPQMKARTCVASFVLDALHVLRPEPEHYGIDTSDDGSVASSAVEDTKGALQLVIEILKLLVPDLSLNLKAWDEYFWIVATVANMGLQEAGAVLHAGFLTLCLELLSIDVDTSVQVQYPAIWRALQRRKQYYNITIECFYFLLTKIDFTAPVVSEHDELQIDGSTNKYPLRECDLELLFQWNAKDNGLVVLSKLLEAWEPALNQQRYTPGEIISLMLRPASDWGIRALIYRTLKNGIETLHTPYAVPYVQASPYYCQDCADVREALELIAAVASNTASLEGHGGRAHLRFFEDLRHVVNPRLFARHGDELFYLQVVEHAGTWAPNLLMYEDAGVRYDTALLVKDVLLSHPYYCGERAFIEVDRLRGVAVRKVLKNCLGKIQSLCNNGANDLMSLPRDFMQPIYQTIKAAGRWLEMLDQMEVQELRELKHAEDRRLLNRFAEFEQWYDTAEEQVEEEQAPSDENWASEAEESEDQEF